MLVLGRLQMGSSTWEGWEMPQRRRLVALAASITLSTTVLGATAAASPTVIPQISLVEGGGFVAVAEQILPSGAVIDTFQSGTDTIKVIGRPGATVQVSKSSDSKQTTFSMSFSITRPKTAEDAGS